MSSPWAKIYVPEPLNLKEIISEEIAKESNKKCNKISRISSKLQDEFCKELFENHGDPNTDAANSFKTTNTSLFFSSENSVHHFDELDFENDYSDEEESENVNKDEENSQHSDEVISKYDIILKSKSSVSNKCSSEVDDNMELYFNMLPNKVCNDSLKLQCKPEHNTQEKLYDRKEDNITAEMVLDFSASLQLHKSINKRILIKVNDVIGEGKEAVVFHSNGNQSYPDVILPKECAVKIYKTALADLKPWEMYMKDNKHVMDRIGRQSIRRTIHLWAQRELQNLFKLKKAGIPCPQPIALKQHVLVMSFIGENHEPAPQLKHAKMETDEYEQAYSQVVKAMKNLYKKAKLIHADLSEYNILWHNKQCWFIDVSQCVEPSHPDTFYFLMKDCENITEFFYNQGVLNMETPEELFKNITGFDNYEGVQMNSSIPNWVISTFHKLQLSH